MNCLKSLCYMPHVKVLVSQDFNLHHVGNKMQDIVFRFYFQLFDFYLYLLSLLCISALYSISDFGIQCEDTSSISVLAQSDQLRLRYHLRYQFWWMDGRSLIYRISNTMWQRNEISGICIYPWLLLVKSVCFRYRFSTGWKYVYCGVSLCHNAIEWDFQTC